MRAADGVAGLDAEFGFQRGEEGFEIGKTESIGLMDEARHDRIDQCGEHDGAHAVGFALRVDALHCFLCLGDGVEEGDAQLLEFDFLELRHQAMAEGFGGQAGAVGDEEYGAFDGIGHD